MSDQQVQDTTVQDSFVGLVQSSGFVYQSNAEKNLEPETWEPLVPAVALHLSATFSPLVEPGLEAEASFTEEYIPQIRAAIYEELGILMPTIHIHGECASLASGSYEIRIYGTPVSKGLIEDNKVLVDAKADDLTVFKMEGTPALNPHTQRLACWVDAEKKEQLKDAGYSTWDAAEYIGLHLSSVLLQHAYRFFGIQETQDLLDQLAVHLPALVEQARQALNLPVLTSILKSLLEEHVSIANLREILECLVQRSTLTQDVYELTELVRVHLRDAISYQYSRADGTLVAYLLDNSLDSSLQKAIQVGRYNTYLDLEPEQSQALLEAIHRELGSLPTGASQPVIVASAPIRWSLRQLIRTQFPCVPVLAYQELDPNQSLLPIAIINLS